jgi:hypothetical protein
MYASSHQKPRDQKPRLTRLAIVLAVGFFFLPVTSGHIGQMGYASAWAGDQGGGHDRVSVNQGYTSYSASQPSQPPDTPCQSCLTGVGSGYTPAAPTTYTDYSASPPASAESCDSCQTGVGSGFNPPFQR